MIIYGIVGAIVGSAAGYFIGKYFHKLGGHCPLLCNPKISTIYFGFIGFIIGYR